MASDHERFLSMLRPIYGRLSRYALAITKDEMAAEDLVSETVLIALHDFGRLRDTSKFLPYLLRIASRLFKRSRYRERNRMQYDPERAAENPDLAPSPELAADIRILRDALETLPIKVRETVILFDISDLSLEEIRTIQGGTVSGVKSRLRRGRNELARRLGVAAPHDHGSRSDPRASANVASRRDIMAIPVHH